MPGSRKMSFRRLRRPVAAGLAGGSALALLTAGSTPAHALPAANTATAAMAATPIKHLVVVFQENVSFDHYFGTYPRAVNPAGEPGFSPARGTPTVNGLGKGLLTSNPNGANPSRLSRAQALTCDQDHDYTAEQQAFHGGRMDRFPQFTQSEDCTPPAAAPPHLVMDYYDGNTVTALWNYAQRFAMSDNSYNTTFGPSTPGALNLVSGQTHGVYSVDPATLKKTATPDPYTVTHPNARGVGTVINDPDPAYDDCSTTAYPRAGMTGRNVGDLLNARHVSWGWFQGGFRPTAAATSASPAVCGSEHTNIGGVAVGDYSAHHEPFQYYRSTANLHHLAPASVAEIGHDGRANHQYDLTDFNRAVGAGALPAVSFIKAAKYQDGHAGYSDPLDEQRFLVRLVNRLQQTPEWHSTAVVLAYDDSDGWYDHQMSPILNSSSDPQTDALNGPGHCGSGTPRLGGFQDRCGYGPRLPLLVISPFSMVNRVDSTLTDQTSILRFVEDNWLGRTRIDNSSFDQLAGTLTHMLDFQHPTTSKLILDPATGKLAG